MYQVNAEDLLKALYQEVSEDVPAENQTKHLRETMLEVKEYLENLAFGEALDGITGEPIK